MYDSMPVGLLEEVFEYVLAEDELNRLSHAQPGTTKAAKQLESRSKELYEAFLIPAADTDKDAAHTSEVLSFFQRNFGVLPQPAPAVQPEAE